MHLVRTTIKRQVKKRTSSPVHQYKYNVENTIPLPWRIVINDARVWIALSCVALIRMGPPSSTHMLQTRNHCSRMHTARLPTISRVSQAPCLGVGEVPPVRSHVQEGYPPPLWTYPPLLEIPTPRRDLVSEIPTPWKGHGTRDTNPAVDRMADICENITFPQHRWRVVIRCVFSFFLYRGMCT